MEAIPTKPAGDSGKAKADTSHLWEEYKLIQGKIDKLGEDKFKVRTWCFTVLTGIVAGAKLSGIEATYATVGVMVIVFFPLIGAFHLVERRQRQIQNRLGERARQLELAWAKIDNACAPGLATFLVKEGKKERDRCSLKKWWSQPDSHSPKRPGQPNENVAESEAKQPQSHRRRINRGHEKPASLLECLTAGADSHFYHTQYLIVSLLVILMLGVRFLQLPSNRRTPEQYGISLHLGTNEFRLNATQTNIVTTNFLTVYRTTTNFIVVQAPTTNFVTTHSGATNAAESAIGPRN